MSRLAAIAKGLYYPTPLRIVAGIEQLLAVEGRPNQILRVLDPCAGTGSAALFFCKLLVAREPDKFSLNEEDKEKCTIRLYGIEMNKDRADLAKDSYYQFITTNALSAFVGEMTFDILFMNPPYDFTGDEEKRLEYQFLERFTRKLRPGGILINIVPRTVFNYIASYQANHYESVVVYKFPEPEYRDFKQMVIVAVKSKAWAENKKVKDNLLLWRTSDYNLQTLDCPDNETTKILINDLGLPVHPDVEKDLKKDDDDDDDSGIADLFQ